MHRSWRLVLVRAWHLDHRRIIRMTLSGDPGQPPRTEYVTSSRSAADQLFQWLEEPAADPEPSDDLMQHDDL